MGGFSEALGRDAKQVALAALYNAQEEDKCKEKSLCMVSRRTDWRASGSWVFHDDQSSHASPPPPTTTDT